MITIKPVTFDDYRKCLDLKLDTDQEEFLDGVEACLAQAYLETLDGVAKVDTFAIYEGEEVVGFVYGTCYNLKESDEGEWEIFYKDFGDRRIYEISAFLIDKTRQRAGVGKAAMKLLLSHIKTTHDDVQSIFIIVLTENAAGLKFFKDFGFVDVGKKVFDDEYILRLCLKEKICNQL